MPAKIPKLGIYLPEKLKQVIQELAESERRSMSQMAVILLEEAIAVRKAKAKRQESE